MNKDTIREAVRDRYGSIASDAGHACCGPASCDTGAAHSFSSRLDYGAKELRSLPEGADLGLGSGNPIAQADLQEGDTVLDLGSGGGIDCFLASREVGPSGKVIGIDMTPEMIVRARRNAQEGGFDNVDFRLGEIEALPVADNSVDVIISNCVLNLSPERDRVLAEALRVLRPGGQLVISDVICDVAIPARLREAAEAVTACLPIERETYGAELQAAGFVDVGITHTKPYPLEALWSTPVAQRIMKEAPDLAESLSGFASSVSGAIIKGRKPEA